MQVDSAADLHKYPSDIYFRDSKECKNETFKKKASQLLGLGPRITLVFVRVLGLG